MMTRIAFIQNKHATTPAIIKHAVRFGRRLREHGIWTYEFPPLIDAAATVCKVRVGRRFVNLFDDGTYTRALLRDSAHIDGRAVVAQSQRMHATYLAMASGYRRINRRPAARAFINFAIEERNHERTSSI